MEYIYLCSSFTQNIQEFMTFITSDSFIHNIKFTKDIYQKTQVDETIIFNYLNVIRKFFINELSYKIKL